MTGLLSPKRDFIFKLLFGNQNNTQILISFLNAIIKPDQPIVKVSLDNSEIAKRQ